jgi:hypothetical protein
MTPSETTLSVPTSGIGESSRSPSPVLHRQPSRSPQPYSRRQQPGRPPVQYSNTYPPVASTEILGSTTPQKGGSESGTEADDELTRRLLAPPKQRRVSSEDDIWNDSGKDGRGRGRENRRGLVARKFERPKRHGIAILRRGIEVGLIAVLVVIVLMGKEQRALREVLLRRRGSPILMVR